MNDVDDYWQEFYSSSLAKRVYLLPSQFAAFVSNEISRDAFIIDVGCGNGRDSLFFGRHGFSVVGFDRSENAISSCKENAPRNCSFECIDVQALEMEKHIPFDHKPKHDNLIIYSRFFLHAINRDLQRIFLEKIADLKYLNPTVYLEFRTEKDADRVKVTPTHYRRYVDLLAFEQDIKEFGLKIDYKVVGTGYAKYLDDDAYVARYILTCN